MSKNKDLLKEAIADAKAVRETAIANAKLALEEAFTPKLQSMLSTKIAEDMEDELEEDELEVDTVDTVEEPVADEVPADESYTEEEEEMPAETYESEDEEVMEMDDEDVAHDEVYEEEGEEEDLELEAIIKELEADEEEVTEVEDEEEPVTEEAEEETVEEEEEMDLEEIIRSLSENDEEEEEVTEEEDVEAELEEAYNTIKSLKSTINEVNLLNSKLLFSNKLFRMHSLSESQKVNVIETFDRASSVREVKLVYTTLAESLVPATSRKRNVTEGFASKRSRSTKPAKNVIVESNNFATRMQKLAGLK
jgi:hypothetical protein